MITHLRIVALSALALLGCGTIHAAAQTTKTMILQLKKETFADYVDQNGKIKNNHDATTENGTKINGIKVIFISNTGESKIKFLRTGYCVPPKTLGVITSNRTILLAP